MLYHVYVCIIMLVVVFICPVLLISFIYDCLKIDCNSFRLGSNINKLNLNVNFSN